MKYVLAIIAVLLGVMFANRDIPITSTAFDMDNDTLCFQTDWQEAECVRFENVYHEDLLPFKVEGVNPDYKVLFIRVDDYFTNGSDGACESFAWLMFNILDEMPEGWQVMVTNHWVPSRKNPIDLKWARVLTEGP